MIEDNLLVFISLFSSKYDDAYFFSLVYKGNPILMEDNLLVFISLSLPKMMMLIIFFHLSKRDKKKPDCLVDQSNIIKQYSISDIQQEPKNKCNTSDSCKGSCMITILHREGGVPQK